MQDVFLSRCISYEPTRISIFDISCYNVTYSYSDGGFSFEIESYRRPRSYKKNKHIYCAGSRAEARSAVSGANIRANGIE
ncbi:hypothetical protein D3C78_946590 [compost metagenome]